AVEKSMVAVDSPDLARGPEIDSARVSSREPSLRCLCTANVFVLLVLRRFSGSKFLEFGSTGVSCRWDCRQGPAAFGGELVAVCSFDPIDQAVVPEQAQ